MARHNPGKKLSSANSITVPRLPPSPTRVDRLVVDQLREHARVVTLVAKMERLRGKPMGSDVHSTLSIWDDAIRKVQALRQEEVRCRSRMALDPVENRVHLEDKGIWLNFLNRFPNFFWCRGFYRFPKTQKNYENKN